MGKGSQEGEENIVQNLGSWYNVKFEGRWMWKEAFKGMESC
jgi:hypothetical protein